MVDTNIKRKRARDTRWQQNNRDRMRELVRLRRQDVQNIFFDMYGTVCVHCGESNRGFLTLDHVCNDGYVERAKYGSNRAYGNYNTYKKAIEAYRPDVYQVLCFNCNCGKGRIGGNLSHCQTWEQSDLQIKFLEMYGTECNCSACNERNPIFLTLDHVQNDGYKFRNVKSYVLATKKYQPDIYQVLCYNCNCGTNRNAGTCPHFGLKIPLERTNKREKLTRKQVEDIRKECVIGSRTAGISALARKYGVWRHTIEDIVHGRSWK